MEDSVLTETMTEPLPNAPPPEQLTRKQIGQLRRAHMTIVHGVVRTCGHKAKFSKDKDPGNNCVYCWEAYFMTAVDLDFIHTVLTQKGTPALVAMKGKKFVRNFHGFLSSKMLPMLAAEIEKSNEEPVNIMGGTFGNGTTGNEIQATSVAE